MRLIVLGVAGAVALGTAGAAVAAPHAPPDVAVVGPALGVAAAGNQVGSGTGPALVLGVVSTAIAPVAKQQPQIAAAVAAGAGQVTATLAKGGAPVSTALLTTRSQVGALAPIVNPLVNPVLDAVAAQLRAQGHDAAGAPLGIVLTGLAPYPEALKGK